MKINEKATDFINSLTRINPEQISESFISPVLLLPKHVDIKILENGSVVTTGLSDQLDKKKRDLLNMIIVEDPLEIKFTRTNILMPRTYAESLSPIPQHISVQCILVSELKENAINDILNLIKDTKYERTNYDKLWIEESDPLESLNDGTLLYIMNRRIGGWDGTPDRPVIELLGAGGHLSTIWNNEENKFEVSDPTVNVQNEIKEEIGLTVDKNSIKIIGGFHNKISNELVMLGCVFVPCTEISSLQSKALHNVEHDTDGLYIGIFSNVLEIYLKNATPFAGGEKAKPSNFPSQTPLMRLVKKNLGIK